MKKHSSKSLLQKIQSDVGLIREHLEDLEYLDQDEVNEEIQKLVTKGENALFMALIEVESLKHSKE